MSQSGGKERKTAPPPGIAWILLVGVQLRIVAVVLRFENLQVDTDAYLAIAQNLLDGYGYCSVPGQPTAFRPPLYPLMLSACLACGGFAAIGIAQVLLGTATIWLTWLIGLRCLLSQRTSLVAAALVAVDPLLIHYTTQSMTETLFTFLVASLLFTTVSAKDTTIRQAVVSGTIFGLTALCRPSIWAFGGLAALIWLAKQLVNHQPLDSSTTGRGSRTTTQALACVTAIAVMVSPWLIRNVLQFQQPILMTTHGGYTLLLGNNETFYQQVVNARRGATWQDDSLNNWQAETERSLAEMRISPTDEVARDTTLGQLARSWIMNNPRKFLHACLLRIQRFWACWPSSSTGVPSWLQQLVGVWYVCVIVLALTGAFRWRSLWPGCWPLGILVVALTLVHTVYWSNARMRSPVIPVISLATAAAFQSSRNRV